jgi:hypothetical protein
MHGRERLACSILEYRSSSSKGRIINKSILLRSYMECPCSLPLSRTPP